MDSIGRPIAACAAVTHSGTDKEEEVKNIKLKCTEKQYGCHFYKSKSNDKCIYLVDDKCRVIEGITEEEHRQNILQGDH
jgi:hypothetical protein